MVDITLDISNMLCMCVYTYTYIMVRIYIYIYIHTHNMHIYTHEICGGSSILSCARFGDGPLFLVEAGSVELSPLELFTAPGAAAPH